MKICMVAESCGKDIGGVERVVHSWSKLLADRGHKVTLVTLAKEPYDIKKCKNIEIFRFSGKIIKTFSDKTYVVSPSIILEIPKMVNLIKKMDVVHIFIVPAPLEAMAMIAAKLMNKPLVSSSHIQYEIVQKTLFPKIKFLQSDFFKNSYYRLCCELFHNNCDIVIGPSKFSIDVLKNNSLSTHSAVISNGINTNKLKTHTSKSRLKETKIIHKYKKVIFVGRLNKDKNIEILIRAAKIVCDRMPYTQFIIVGDGPEKFYLEKLSEEIGVGDKVIFTGYVNAEKLNRLYSVSDVLAITSTAEMQGLVLLEAALMGKPLIGTRSSAITEIIVDGKNGYTFEPNNHMDLARKIIKILGNRRLRKKMGEYSLNIVKSHDMEKSIIEMEKIYLDISKTKENRKYLQERKSNRK
jgi:glycosyltransferase involved in cell wall biosynthesis